MPRDMLSEDTKFTSLSVAISAGTTAVLGSSVDMTGFDGVQFFAIFGTGATDNTMNAAQSTDDATFVDLEGTEVAATTATPAVTVDIIRTQARYARPEVTRGTSSTLDALFALQYRGRVNDATITEAGRIIGERHISPSTGTK